MTAVAVAIEARASRLRGFRNLFIGFTIGFVTLRSETDAPLPASADAVRLLKTAFRICLCITGVWAGTPDLETTLDERPAPRLGFPNFQEESCAPS